MGFFKKREVGNNFSFFMSITFLYLSLGLRIVVAQLIFFNPDDKSIDIFKYTSNWERQ